jgi:hypothetical protein
MSGNIHITKVILKFFMLAIFQVFPHLATLILILCSFGS